MARRQLETKKRGINKRKSKPVYLMIAEGRNKTEKQYFSNFQGQSHGFSLRFVNAGNNTDVESLYKAIVLKWKDMELNSEAGDKAYVVIDLDNDSHKAELLVECMKANNNPSIYFIVSNPTFEIWFLLHFRYTTKHFETGDELMTELRKYIPQYKKNQDEYVSLQDKMNDAIYNSKQLEQYFGSARWPSEQCNPRTDVGRLVEMLLQ